MRGTFRDAARDLVAARAQGRQWVDVLDVLKRTSFNGSALSVSREAASFRRTLVK